MYNYIYIYIDGLIKQHACHWGGLIFQNVLKPQTSPNKFNKFDPLGRLGGRYTYHLGMVFTTYPW